MTAVNIFLQGEAAHLMTDGAMYEPDGRIVSFEQKVFPLAPVNMVLATRGYSFALPFIAAFVNELSDTFDGAVRDLPKTYNRMLAMQPPERAKLLRQPLEIFAVGISEATGKADAWGMVNDRSYGMPVLQPFSLSEGVILPADPEFVDRTLPALGLDPAGVDFDPARDGLRIMQEQRARAWPMDMRGQPLRAIGGFCQLTTVTAGTVTTRILERWHEDKVGEKIGA